MSGQRGEGSGGAGTGQSRPGYIESDSRPIATMVAPVPARTTIINEPMTLRAIADLQVVPVGTGSASVSQHIAAIHRLLDDAVKHQQIDRFLMHACGTNIEGPIDSLLATVAAIHRALHAQQGIVRVASDLRLGTRIDKNSSIDQRIRSVDSVLGGAVSAATGVVGAGGHSDTLAETERTKTKTPEPSQTDALLISVPERVSSIPIPTTIATSATLAQASDDMDDAVSVNSDAGHDNDKGGSDSSIEVMLTPTGEKSAAIGPPAATAARFGNGKPGASVASSSGSASSTPGHSRTGSVDAATQTQAAANSGGSKATTTSTSLSVDAAPFVPVPVPVSVTVTGPRRTQSYVNMTAAAMGASETAHQAHGVTRTGSGNVVALSGPSGNSTSSLTSIMSLSQQPEGFRRERRVSLAPGSPARPSPLSSANHEQHPRSQPWRRKSHSQTEQLPTEEMSWRRERQPSASSGHGGQSPQLSAQPGPSRRRPSGASLSGFTMTPIAVPAVSTTTTASLAVPGDGSVTAQRRKSLPPAAFHRPRSSPTPTNAINTAVAQQLHLISEQAKQLQAQVELLEGGLGQPAISVQAEQPPAEPATYPPGITSNPNLEVFVKHLPRQTSKMALFAAFTSAFSGMVKSVTVPFANRDFGYVEFSEKAAMERALVEGGIEFEGRRVSVENKRERGGHEEGHV